MNYSYIDKLELNTKKYKMIAFWAIVVITILIQITPAFASRSDNEAHLEGMLKQIMTGSSQIVTGAFSKAEIKGDDFKQSSIKQLRNFVDQLLVTGDGGEGIYSKAVIKTLTETFKLIGAFLAIIITLAHLFNAVEREQDTMEVVFKSLMELCLTLLFMINLEAILDLLMQLGQIIISDACKTTGTENYDKTITAMINEIKSDASAQGVGLIDFIKALALLIFPWILSWIINMYTMFLVASMVIEVAVRRILAPLAVADIYKEGWHSPGAKYLKKLFASILKIVVALVIAYVCSSITNGAATLTKGGGTFAAVSTCFMLITIQLVCAGTIAKSGEIVNDVVGA